MSLVRVRYSAVVARAGALRVLPRILALTWAAHPAFTALMVLLRLLRAVVPVLQLWVAKLILDAVVHAVGSKTGSTPADAIWRLVASEFGLAVLSDLLLRSSLLVESLLGDLFTNHASVRLMEHASMLDLAQFEDPATHDLLERARDRTAGRIMLLTQVIGLAQDAITLAFLAALLVAQSPWLLALLVATVLPTFIGETHFAVLSRALLYQRTPERRMLDYLRLIGASKDTAKEVQMFGLGHWLTSRFRRMSAAHYRESARLALSRTAVNALLSVLAVVGYYVAYVVIVQRTISGLISIGTLALLAGSFARGRDLTQRLMLSASDVLAQSLNMADLFAFFALRPRIVSSPGAPTVRLPINTGFVFERVGFRYAEDARWAVRGIDLTIRPGERVALVGENGAGKTTITKLLARLYDPSEGRILLDGRDLREYDLSSVRKAIGVLFQDFVRYDLRFEENVGVGAIEETGAYLDHSLAASENGQTAAAAFRKIRAATEGSLASAVLTRLPHGYQQLLGRRFEGGTELSGGEWQKVALARGYLRDAELLILDEPTAALDARAEFEVFSRFAQLMRQRMAVIVSHRFSTVRMADKIVVLKSGSVVERGTHDELMALHGLYAELFEMQAVGYR